MEQWIRICEKDLVGIWECYRESDITGDPACKTQYKWRLSMPQVKMAFIDSQPSDQIARPSHRHGSRCWTSRSSWRRRTLGRQVRGQGSPAQRCGCRDFYKTFSEATPDEVVIKATYIHAERYDAEETKPLKGETQKDLEVARMLGAHGDHGCAPWALWGRRCTTSSIHFSRSSAHLPRLHSLYLGGQR